MSIRNKTTIRCEILAYWDTEQEAFDHEVFLISTLDGLCNLSKGGEGPSGYKLSEDQCKLRSQRLKVWHKENPGAAKKWAVNRNYGVTEHQREVLRQLRIGTKMAEETKQKISETTKGRPKHEGFGDQISELMTAAWQSADFIQKQKNGVVAARGRAVVNTTTREVFITVTDAVKWLKENGYPKMSTSWLCRCIKNSRELTCGKFAYKE